MRTRKEIVTAVEGKSWLIGMGCIVEILLDIRDLLVPTEITIQVCPPHNMVPFSYSGAWGGINPPPTMQCTRCLLLN